MSDRKGIEYITNKKQYYLTFVTSNDGSGYGIFKLEGYKIQEIPEEIRGIVTYDESYQLFINGVNVNHRYIELVDALDNAPRCTDTLFKIHSDIGYSVTANDEAFVIGRFEES